MAVVAALAVIAALAPAQAQANNAATGEPEITVPNVYRVPAVLTAGSGTIADADGLTSPTYTYQWYRVDADGTSNETAITGATSSTYTLTASDVGKRIRVQLSFADDDGNSESRKSDAVPSSGTVTAAATCNAPSYPAYTTQLWTGTVTVGELFSHYGYFNFASLSAFAGGITSDVWGDRTIFGAITGADFQMFLDPGTTLLDVEGIDLYVCDRKFAFSDAVNSEADDFFRSTWYSSGQDWSGHAERTLYLARTNPPPALESAVVSGDKLVLTFDEALDTASVPAASAFTAKVGGAAVSLASGSPAVVNGSTVTLMLASAVSAGQVVTVSYARPASGNKLRDTSMGETESFDDQAVVNIAAPKPVSVRVNGRSVVLAFSKDLAAASLSRNDFAVSYKSSRVRTQRPIYGSPSISGNELTLVVDRRFGEYDRLSNTAILVEYSRPTSGTGNRLADMAGNEVESFSFERSYSDDTPFEMYEARTFLSTPAQLSLRAVCACVSGPLVISLTHESLLN